MLPASIPPIGNAALGAYPIESYLERYLFTNPSISGGDMTFTGVNGFTAIGDTTNLIHDAGQKSLIAATTTPSLNLNSLIPDILTASGSLGVWVRNTPSWVTGGRKPIFSSSVNSDDNRYIHFSAFSLIYRENSNSFGSAYYTLEFDDTGYDDTEWNHFCWVGNNSYTNKVKFFHNGVERALVSSQGSPNGGTNAWIASMSDVNTIRMFKMDRSTSDSYVAQGTELADAIISLDNFTPEQVLAIYQHGRNKL